MNGAERFKGETDTFTRSLFGSYKDNDSQEKVLYGKSKHLSRVYVMEGRIIMKGF